MPRASFQSKKMGLPWKNNHQSPDSLLARCLYFKTVQHHITVTTLIHPLNDVATMFVWRDLCLCRYIPIKFIHATDMYSAWENRHSSRHVRKYRMLFTDFLRFPILVVFPSVQHLCYVYLNLFAGSIVASLPHSASTATCCIMVGASSGSYLVNLVTTLRSSFVFNLNKNHLSINT